MPTQQYSTDFDPQRGTPVAVADGIVRVTAPNAGPYTFTGTNSFVLGREEVMILDPGPDSPSHLQALLSAIGGRRVAGILLTHTHPDHCALVPRLQSATGAPLLSGGPHRYSRKPTLSESLMRRKGIGFRLKPDTTLWDGQPLELDGLTLTAVATPGHCANHFAFAVEGTRLLLSGDHVMGWNSTLIASPDGRLSDYFASLDKVIALHQTRFVPAHGGEIADGRGFAKALKAHRMMRNSQIVDALGTGPQSLRQITAAIYPQLRGRLALAAQQTVLAHLEYLADKDAISLKRGIFGVRAWLSA
ncbi:MBL fold metallo-hydrolase [Pelagibacterium xiamenense]|uniref:MBL fold metallo-hydrolase n=1 Tax=Pelagibacterium xiamenense TaxID=2901140 RepID=UPI001E442C46|nr:MBL fold metallo-hydrolase [Pelagibacterium xiamenense]MCD7059348.1 MBL fold metallo-hydrolase [Pelagibacterium xiamenense]